MATIGTIGSELNLKFRQGTTFGPYQVTISDENGNPFNLTGYTFTANIKKNYKSKTSLTQVQTLPVDIENGVVALYISSTETTKCKGNPDGDAEYVWDYEIIDSEGKIEPIFYGTVTSFADV